MTWKAPKGYTLVTHPGHYLDARGFRVDEAQGVHAKGLMPDGQIQVLWFDDDEPFAETENDGRGPHASDEAIAAAAAGKPIKGWNPKATLKPIQGGWHPPVYQLTRDDDPTPKTEPAGTRGRMLTPREEIAALEASVAAATERIAHLKGAS